MATGPEQQASQAQAHPKEKEATGRNFSHCGPPEGCSPDRGAGTRWPSVSPLRRLRLCLLLTRL